MSIEVPERLCLFGAGGHGRVVARQAQWLNVSELCFADGETSVGERIADVPVCFSSVDLITNYAVIVTIGDNVRRRQIYEQCLTVGHEMGTLVVDPNRFFGFPPGSGTMALAGSSVNDAARIGANVIVNTGAIVEHDVHVGDHCHLAPGCVLGGAAKVGDGVLLGSNATVLPGVSICDDAVIGAGAVVSRDIDKPGTYAGVPARKLHSTGRSQYT